MAWRKLLLKTLLSFRHLVYLNYIELHASYDFNSEVSINLQPEDCITPPRPLAVTTCNRNPLSEQFLSLHEMCEIRYRDVAILREERQMTTDRNVIAIWSIIDVDLMIDAFASSPLSPSPSPPQDLVIYGALSSSSLNTVRDRRDVRDSALRLLLDSNIREGGEVITRTTNPSLSTPGATNSYNFAVPSLPGAPAAGRSVSDDDATPIMVTPLQELPELNDSSIVPPPPPGGASPLADGNTALIPSVAGGFPLRIRPLISSTPLNTFRPRLTVIDEEQLRRGTILDLLNQEQNSPAVAEVANAEIEMPAIEVLAPAAPPVSLQITPPPSPSREWTSILRPRSVGVNYAIPPAPPIGHRRRPNRPPTNLIRNRDQEEQQQQQEQISNQEIVTSFLQNILKVTIENYNSNPPGITEIEPMREQPPIAVEEEQEMEIPPLAIMPENPKINDQHLLSSGIIEPIPNHVVEQENTEISASIPPPMPENDSALLPVAPSIGTLSEQLAALPENAVVTSMSIICQPSTQSSLNDLAPVASSTFATPATRLMTETLNANVITPIAPLASAAPPQDRFYRENQENLSFLVQHSDVIRLMVDHTKQLSDQQQQKTSSFRPTHNVRSLPAIYTYDPKLILEADPTIVRLTHAIFGALIMMSKVDLHNVSFITNRAELAQALQIIFDLVAAKIVGISSDSRYCWLL
ncbi:sister chromatid cohesion protein solo [Drosophila tropicalis]|uniref:sister chromatid cohesion protein solo n=1 Tax=Drosophila tropicalis TaxID=46794 RepID=UPI0035ABBB85